MTTQFEIGKNYGTEYGYITIITRTAQYVTFTETLIEDTFGNKVESVSSERRKKVEIVNGRELVDNYYVYTADREFVENEEVIDLDSYEQELQELKGCFIENPSGHEWKINQVWVRKTYPNQHKQSHVSVNAKCTLWIHRECANRGYGVKATLTLTDTMKFIKVEGKKVKKEKIVKPPKLIDKWIAVKV